VTAGGALRSIVQRLIENLSQPVEGGENKLLLIRQLRSSNNWAALRAVERLRAIGAMEDGSLHQAILVSANLATADLHRANLNHANLQEADLQGVNLAEARLSGVDLLGANLTGATLHRADLSSANLFRARLAEADLREAFLFQVDLRGADFTDADLAGARISTARLDGSNVALTQLVHAGMLCGTSMPDGRRYDGRFNLPGDLQFARFLDMEMDLTDPLKMAEFYDVPPSDYLRGQDWAQTFLRQLREPVSAHIRSGSQASSVASND
jgi:uncharacterized protein YjbI with pentapeptide repeats